MAWRVARILGLEVRALRRSLHHILETSCLCRRIENRIEGLKNLDVPLVSKVFVYGCTDPYGVSYSCSIRATHDMVCIQHDI